MEFPVGTTKPPLRLFRSYRPVELDGLPPFIQASSDKLKSFQQRELSNEDIVALFIDGKTFADDQRVVALGITIEGCAACQPLTASDTLPIEDNGVSTTYALRGYRWANGPDGLPTGPHAWRARQSAGFGGVHSGEEVVSFQLEENMLPIGRAGPQTLQALAVTIKALATSRGPLQPDVLDRRDPELIARLLPGMQAINRYYLRLALSGLEQLPASPAIYIANHNSGIMGPDLCCIMATLWNARGPAAPIYALAHDFAMRRLTPLGLLLQRLGAVRACPQNARRVLDAGGQVLVFPGGDIDAFRHFRRRNSIVWGERCGFARLAQATGAPLVPLVVQGAHRSALILHEGVRFARALKLHQTLRVNCFPVALALPWGVAVGPGLPYLPLPFSIRLRMLDPIQVGPDEDPRAAARSVRLKMQQALGELCLSPSGGCAAAGS